MLKNITNKITPEKKKDLLIMILLTSGFFCMFGAAGTEDYRTEIEEENRIAGYEKYSDDDIASEKSTIALALTGLGLLGGAAFLSQKEEQKKMLQNNMNTRTR